jgi:hypothetical protein
MTYVFISPQGQTTWNTDCADDADAHGYDLPVFVFDQKEDNKKVKFMNDRKAIFGSEPPNPRVSAQSAASAFLFRFDGYYFINPNNHAQNQANSISCCFLCHSNYEITPQQIKSIQRSRFSGHYQKININRPIYI